MRGAPEIPDKVVAHLREKRRSAPPTSRSSRVSRKYAIPSMEYFDSQRVLSAKANAAPS